MTAWKKTVYASWLAQVFSIMGFTCVLHFLPFYIQELGVEGEAEVKIWAGYVSAAAGVTLVLFAPIWGMVADRFGRKPMVMRSMFGGAVVLIVMAFCRNVEQLLVCRFIQGTLTGTVTASVALVASVAPRERAGFALGLMGSAMYAGASVGPFIGGVLWDRFGHHAAFFAAAVLLAVGGLLVKFAVREEFTPAHAQDAAERGSFGEVFAAAGFLAVVFAYFTIRFAYAVAAPVFPLFVRELSGTEVGVKTVTGAIVSVGGVAAALSAAAVGRFSDSWGHKRLLIVASMFTGAIAVVHASAQSVAHLFALRVLFGLGVGVMIPAVNAIIRGVTHDKNIGRAYGAATSLTFIGYIVGPLAGGYLAASLGNRAPFVLMGLAYVVAAFLVRSRVRPDTAAATISGASACDPGCRAESS